MKRLSCLVTTFDILDMRKIKYRISIFLKYRYLSKISIYRNCLINMQLKSSISTVFSRQKTEKTTKSLASETSSMLKQLSLLDADDPNEQVELTKMSLDQT